MSQFLARPPVRDARFTKQESTRAFTLIELLAVIAIIGILTAITFGIVKGVNERAAVGQAKAELSVLAQALEQYKRQYGDYPQSGSTSSTPETTASATGQSGKLFNALLGKLGPTGVAIDGKVFVDAATFSLSTTTLPSTAVGDTTSVANAFIDPWGRFYVYAYASGWTTYRLLSVGPDGKGGDTFDSKGAITTNATNGADNIYATK